MLSAFLDLPERPLRVVVVGDIIVDHYVWGMSERLSPEAPVQVVEVLEETYRLGGAANVVDNLVALGAQVDLCGVVGADWGQTWLFGALENLGVPLQGICIDAERPTSLKSRVMISKQQVLRIDREKVTPINSSLRTSLSKRANTLLEKADVLVLSDYQKGVLDTSLCQELIACAQEQNKIVLCDPKGKDYSKYQNATLLTPNKKEAQIATGIDITDDARLLQALHALKTRFDLGTALITLSEQGIAFLDQEHLVKIPTIAKEVYDVSGAGDTVIAALAFCLGLGLNIQQACTFANGAAAVVVGKVGSARASYAEVLDFLQQHNHSGQKVLDRQTLSHILHTMHKKQVVFTNGCFDMLHRGHVHYLQEAKKLGDVLIVGLNSDSSVRLLKGDTRPIQNQEDRAFILASLECVDFVVIFEEQTPLELIKALRPDILVKGGDYKDKEVVGHNLVQKVVFIDFIEGNSTTNTIQKIQGLACKPLSNKNS